MGGGRVAIDANAAHEKLYGRRTYGRMGPVHACDVDLFVLVSYGHYDYAQVNNFQRTQLARYVAHECIQDWHACAAA